MENAERDRMLANDPDHEEGEMYSGSDGDYDGGRRGVEYRSRRGSGKEFVDARELIRESRRARSRSADSFSKTIHAFMTIWLFQAREVPFAEGGLLDSASASRLPATDGRVSGARSDER